MIIVFKKVLLKYFYLKRFISRFPAKFLDYEKYKYPACKSPSTINMFHKKDQHKQQEDSLTQMADAVLLPPPKSPLSFPPPMSSFQSPSANLVSQAKPAPFPSLLSYGSDQCPWLVSCPQGPLNPPLPPYSPPAPPPLPLSPPPLNPPLPLSPPPPSYPPPPQPPLPPSSPPTAPPSPSSLPQPDLHMLKSADMSSPFKKDSRFAHLPVHGSLPLPSLSKILSGFKYTGATNTSAESGCASHSFFVDKMPSKVYIEVDKPRKLRQKIIHNRYVPSPPHQRAKVSTPIRNLVPTQIFGPIRSHYKNKRLTPELITLSDDEDDVCVLEKENNILVTDEVLRNKAVMPSTVSCLLSPIPVEDIRLPDQPSTLIIPEGVGQTDPPSTSTTTTSSPSFLSQSISNFDINLHSSINMQIQHSIGLIPPSSSENVTSQIPTSVSSIIKRIEHDKPSNPISTEKINVSCSSAVLHSANLTEQTVDGILIDSETGKEIVEVGCDDDCDEENDHADSRKSMEVEVSPLSYENKSTSEPYEVQQDLIKGLDVIDKEYVPLSSIKLSDVINQNIYISDDTFEMRQALQDLRKWESTGFAMHHNIRDPNDVVFTIMCYNVLCQQLLRANMYLYKNCNVEHLQWQYRWTLLQHEITEMNPDILTLQEVQSNHYHEFYLPWFTHLGYEGVYKKRTGNQKADGCAIFFRKEKFTLLESISIEYCQPQTFLNRDNIGLVCSLKSTENDASICVATTHLLFNPKRHEIRLAQVQLLLAEVERLSYTGVNRNTGLPEYTPVIVTGDMNAVPQSTLINFLKNGSLDYNGRMMNHSLPSRLGVTNTCQHEAVLQLRLLLQERARAPGARPITRQEQRHLEETRLGLYHSERENRQQQHQQQQNSDEGHCDPLQHPFSLRSVFKHTLPRLGGAPEITTMASTHQTVDYILYSLVFSMQHGRPVEGSLRLLARYGLLSASELRQFGPAPSAVLPSDHVPLAAKFLLKRCR